MAFTTANVTGSTTSTHIVRSNFSNHGVVVRHVTSYVTNKTTSMQNNTSTGRMLTDTADLEELSFKKKKKPKLKVDAFYSSNLIVFDSVCFGSPLQPRSHATRMPHCFALTCQSETVATETGYQATKTKKKTTFVRLYVRRVWNLSERRLHGNEKAVHRCTRRG